jgi:uncharacterized protein (DUF1800 family)
MLRQSVAAVYDRRVLKWLAIVAVVFATGTSASTGLAQKTGPARWQNDLTAIEPSDWNSDFAAHLLERAGFGGTPEDIQALARLTPAEAVRQLVYFQNIQNTLPPFDHSGIHDSGLEPFPESRPAVTKLAKEKGEALGIQVKPGGDRPLQPIVNKFFYWLRASALETQRVSYWWANRMVVTKHPLEEKMALFWHGHFAINESKVRDYRKMLGQLEVFYKYGTGNFRDLMIAEAKHPAMLSFLDAGVNVKGAPNENFAREIMELFTMGVGNYTEKDIREAARAFTGWNYVDLEFVVNKAQHDDGSKTFLGKTGSFDGVDVIDIILQQPVTARFIAGKIYRYFVRQDLSPEIQNRLGDVLRNANYNLAPLLETIFLSRDFYSPASVGTQIKSPVQLAISTYRKLGLQDAPGVPDFNIATGTLGQRLFAPPTVAGWAEGRSWITPGLLLERGNFIRDVLFPDINFIPPDRANPSSDIRVVADKIRAGLDISTATMPDRGSEGGLAESNMLADRDEDFNTRYGSFRGWQMAIERVRPIPRQAANIDFTRMVVDAGVKTTDETVDYFIRRFMRVPPSPEKRQAFVKFLNKELGTPDIARAKSYMEDTLRLLVHLIMSEPEYQLG